ncbi:MAG: hypothetical protein JO314_00330 [Acidobacteria bacterium]|nr:hypothetical protein [Acidobacteriota bacterium]
MLSRRLLMPFIFAVIIAGGAVATSAKEWKKIDSTVISNHMDHATIFVPDPDVYDVRFRMVKLSVAKSAVRITRVVVTFGNDEQVEIALTDLIPVGGSTKDLNISGTRYVKRVDFWFDKDSLTGKNASVTLWAYPE